MRIEAVYPYLGSMELHISEPVSGLVPHFCKRSIYDDITKNDSSNLRFCVLASQSELCAVCMCMSMHGIVY